MESSRKEAEERQQTKLWTRVAEEDRVPKRGHKMRSFLDAKTGEITMGEEFIMLWLCEETDEGKEDEVACLDEEDDEIPENQVVPKVNQMRECNVKVQNQPSP